MTDQAARVTVGLSERSACKLSGVCRDTLQRHERGEIIATLRKRWRLRVFYGSMRLVLRMCSWAKEESENMSDDDDGDVEDKVPTLPPPSFVVADFRAA
jgi:predicted transcriptional regulator